MRVGKGRAGEWWAGLGSPAAGAWPCLQIQVFLLGGNHKRVLVRVERMTVFSVDHDNTLELATAYYLGGVPPEQLPPRWEPGRGHLAWDRGVWEDGLG